MVTVNDVIKKYGQDIFKEVIEDFFRAESVRENLNHFYWTEDIELDDVPVSRSLVRSVVSEGHITLKIPIDGKVTPTKMERT